MQTGDLTRQEAIDEFTADYAMRTLFADAKTANEVTKKHSKLAEAIRNAIAWIREHIFKQDVKSVDRAAKIWNDAYNEARRNKSSTADMSSAGAKNSLAYADEAITTADVEAIRSIGRKSINDFSSEDIQATEKWARKFYRELGTKSPFFRAWFGDWRAYDISTASVVTASDTHNKASGKAKNSDTGMTISWSSDLRGETRMHAVKEKASIRATNDIESIVKNAVYIDTVTSKPSGTKKMPGTAFMHSFYTLYQDGGGTYLLKMYVEEAVSMKDNTVFDRAYQLKDIEKVASIPSGVLSENGGLTSETDATTYSISDLYALVKQYDKDFNPKAVNPVLLNEDGTPKVVYHGTNSAAFYEFDSGKSDKRVKLNTLGDGYYFTSDKYVAERYGKNVMSVYLDLKNPYRVYARDGGIRAQIAEDFQVDADGISRNDIQAILKKHGYDGVLLYSSKYAADNAFSTAVAFQNTQIKSATDNIGTFDSANADIRYSTTADDISGIAEERQRGTFAEVTAGLRQQESDARKAKREFLPDMQTLGEVTRSLAEMGLADGVTQAQLSKAVQNAAVAMRAAYLERNGSEAKARKRTTAAGKLLAAARLLARQDGVTVAETAQYIENLRACGIPAGMDVYPTDMHAFDMLQPDTPLGIEAARRFNEQFAYAQAHYFAAQG